MTRQSSELTRIEVGQHPLHSHDEPGSRANRERSRPIMDERPGIGTYSGPTRPAPSLDTRRDAATTVEREEAVRLTNREAEILVMIAEGLKSDEVADDLCLSKRTIDYHLSKAYVKLGATNRIQAIITASSMGLLPFEPKVVAPVMHKSTYQNGNPGHPEDMRPRGTPLRNARQESING